MKKFRKFLIALFCAAFIAVPVLFTACGEKDDNSDKGNNNPPAGTVDPDPEFIDYASQLTLDLNSDTKKQEVTVKLYIDGDTTHFDPVTNSTITGYNAADFAGTQGYIKARYIAINTPESTGKIEKWGKRASNFTHDKLAAATSIIVESDTSSWDIDSTGERYVVWVWYKTAGATEYKNLNVEILQEGLARASSTDNNRYGTIATNALEQARAFKLLVFSPANTKDDLFYEGDIIPVTLRELRCHVDDYLSKQVSVEGTVFAKFDNSVYIEDYDAETDTYFGMSVFYGYQTGSIIDILSVNNRVTVVGYVSEFQGTYQISGVEHNDFKPNAPTNTNLVGEAGAYSAAYRETEANDIINGNLAVNFVVEDSEGVETTETVNLKYAEAAMSTSVTLKNLTVTSIYTTSNGGSSDGAMSITCMAEDGTVIVIRTEVLTDSEGKLVTAAKFPVGTKLNVKGLIGKYTNNSGNVSYQVQCHRADFLTVID